MKTAIRLRLRLLLYVYYVITVTIIYVLKIIHEFKNNLNFLPSLRAWDTPTLLIFLLFSHDVCVYIIRGVEIDRGNIANSPKFK